MIRDEIRARLEAAVSAQRHLGAACHVARSLPRGASGEDALLAAALLIVDASRAAGASAEEVAAAVGDVAAGLLAKLPALGAHDGKRNA